MKKLVLRKLPFGPYKHQYRAYLDGEQVYRTSPTEREYVAIAFEQSRDGEFKVLNRFGRVDLIGKGNSKDYITNPYVYLAVREDVEKHVRYLFAQPAGADLSLNDVMHFFGSVNWNKLEAYLKENIPKADHFMERLARFSNQYGMFSPTGLFFWIDSMDQPHRDLIERYIIENHKK